MVQLCRQPSNPTWHLIGMMRFWWVMCLLFLTCWPVTAWTHEKVRYNRDVRPILSDKCFSCHGPDGQKRQAGLRLDERAAAIDSGAITPGEPETSELLTRVMSSDPEYQMPPPRSKLERLSAQEIDTLRRWIAEGAEYEAHWSFLPVQRPPLLATEDHPIDALVQRALNRRGWQLQPPATRSVLLRRLSLDLTGLPPTPEELRAFEEDVDPQAYEKQVDRLLASPRFGERWAVDWLDVARYADSYGFQVDRERAMWPWRDWVVRAFNHNLPFDQFLTWQLAGDLLPQPTDETILATAFNRLHQMESEGGSVEEEYRVEYVCDRVQTFSTAFLGLTLECARCHDHKYDPVSQREFYQLFAFFQNIDEAGLYSYFTSSPVTPTLWLVDEARRQQWQHFKQAVGEQEEQAARLWSTKPPTFDLAAFWQRWHEQSLTFPEELAHFSFDRQEGNKLPNLVDVGKPAQIHGDNRLVPGVSGLAVEFSGDDPVLLQQGNFHRYEPFSVSLWLWTPDVKDRAVVFHRSRAWTDAGSRGYELLIEEGRLKWSLIHFWPGNAISIRSRHPIPVQTWLHVGVTYDGSSRASGLKLYMNGRPAETEVIRDHLTKEITGGGGDHITLGERFRDRGFTRGRLDEFRLFARELTPLEMLALGDRQAFDTLWNKPLTALTEDERQACLQYHLSAHDDDWRRHLQELQHVRQQLAEFVEGIEEIMVMRELSQPKPAYVLFRGEYDKPREEVVAGTPACLPPFPEGAPRNRLGLAQWLTDRRHPLTSRVTVNRFWQSLFGRGLVKTAEDFGSQGARPVHPDLLDWLAAEFMDSGWDVKRLLKTIVMSRTYQQSSQAPPEILAEDPENEWLARGARFRLPAEMLRDQALFVSGLLVERLGGPPVYPYELSESFKPVQPSSGDGVYRRSVYTFWRRTGPPPAMLAFDAPRRAVCVARRERTESPLQALILLNGTQYVEAARVLGSRLYRETQGNVDAMIQLGFVRCLCRPPDPVECDVMRTLYHEQRAYFGQRLPQAEEFLRVGQTPPDPQIPKNDAVAAAILAQALLNHVECVMKH
ncbi:MAG: hypothetical protein KatS3mg113_0141 [Planctomycetaceae bacterium]|nr:MAG: hypothetical protein KatS3mg113_0141 [Planctomycetaceae bacterium]